MKKSEATISLHRPSFNEMLFFLLSGAIVSVPLTLFVEQNFGSPLLAGFSSFDVTLITIALFAPAVVTYSVIVLAITLFASWQLHDKTKEKFIQTEHVTCSG